MTTRILEIAAISALVLVACQPSGDSQSTPTPATDSTAAAQPAHANAELSFVNKVWVVTESKQVSPGELRVFLADGTLVMASPHAKPAFGSWHEGDGRLTITEEGHDYAVDILALSDDSFHIRMQSAGEPVEIEFAPAEPVPPGSVAGSDRASAAADVIPAAVVLWGTAWRLEQLGGAGVLDRAQATLEFPSEGRAAGNGSCNRFNGVVTIEGDAMHFAGIAATRKACPDAVMRQEDGYFAALRDADRFTSDGQSLEIFSEGRPEPLRFVAGPAPAERPASSIERAPAGAGTVPALTGIWTVVAHHGPGAGAPGDDAAKAHHGESLRLTARAAVSAGERCSMPRYAARRVPAETYLASEFGLSPGSLPALAGRNQIEVMDVSCGGTPWTALGGRLLQIDRDRALAPWNGAFFELKRDRDFRALGQEPGWQLEIHQGAEMRLTYDYGKGTAVTPASRVQVDPSSGTRTYHAVAEANDLRVVIVPVRCTDTMSGRPFPATVSVTLNGRSFRGCGEELATPYEG